MLSQAKATNFKATGQAYLLMSLASNRAIGQKVGILAQVKGLIHRTLSINGYEGYKKVDVLGIPI